MRGRLLAVSLLAVILLAAACGDDGAPAAPPPVVPVELAAVAGEPVYAVVGDTITLDGSASPGATQYQWNFGDGEAWDAPREEAVATKRYDTAGRYTAVLTVFDAEANRRSASVLVTVTEPRVFEPSQSSTVAIVPGREEVAVVSPDSDELTRFSWTDDGTLSLVRRDAVCGHPRTVTAWAGWLVVPCEEDEVSFVAQEGDEAFSVEMPRGSRPFGAVGLDGAVYVSLQGSGQMARLEVDGVVGATAWFDGLPDARGMAALPDGRLAVTRWRSPDERGEVYVLDPTSGAVTPWPLAFDPQASSDTESGGVPTYLEQVLVSPTGLEAVVPSLQANIGEGTFLSERPLTFQTSVRGVVSYLSLPGGEETLDQRKQFDNRGFASAGAITHRGDFAYLAMRGSRAVDRVDLLSGGQSGSILDVGYAPQGLALSPDDRFLFVDAYLSRQLVVYDVSDLSSAPAALARGTIPSSEPLSPTLLRGKQLFNDSYDPRLAKDSYIACAHCHLEGRDDHRTWDFTDRGEGLRNTISLIGRAGTAPIHWSANFDEVHDFENDIRGPFGGAGLLSDADFAEAENTLGPTKAGRSEDLDALAAYVASLTAYPPSPHRTSEGALTEAAARGKLIFEDAAVGCTTCHSGPDLSDSKFVAPGQPLLHDVGTLGPGSGSRLGEPLLGIDTPSLHGLWESAPYLHDGSAPTLLDVLSQNADDAHGVTSGLSSDDLDDVVAYLLSLDGQVD